MQRIQQFCNWDLCQFNTRNYENIFDILNDILDYDVLEKQNKNKISNIIKKYDLLDLDIYSDISPNNILVTIVFSDNNEKYEQMYISIYKTTDNYYIDCLDWDCDNYTERFPSDDKIPDRREKYFKDIELDLDKLEKHIILENLSINHSLSDNELKNIVKNMGELFNLKFKNEILDILGKMNYDKYVTNNCASIKTHWQNELNKYHNAGYFWRELYEYDE